MSEILVVFGATGNQGGSVITTVLNDSTLSTRFKIRAVTRDPSSTSSRSLAEKGIEVVKGDFSHPETIKQAVQGAHTVFANTVTIYAPGGANQEIEQGKCITDACVAAKVKHLIYSSMVSPKIESKGKLQRVEHFDCKNEVEQYIRSFQQTDMKTTFYWPGSFMSNLATFQKPRKQEDGTYAIMNINHPSTKLPLLDIEADTGKYIACALAEPDKFNGKVLYGSQGLYSQTEIADIMSRVTGKTIVHKQMPEEVMKGFYPPGFRDQMADMTLYLRDFGYFGSDEVMQKKLDETNECVKGELTSFEEYLRRNPIDLDTEGGH